MHTDRAPQAASRPNRCPRCGGAFACGMGGADPCPCTTVSLDAATLADLRARHQGCLCLGCLQALAAGAPVVPEPYTPPEPWELPKPALGPWRAGNTGTEGVWHVDSGQPGHRVLITALVHGNELCGAWALAGLLAAGIRPRRGALTLAFCNLAAFDRFDPANPSTARCVEEDFNRVWQADKLADPCTAERRRALQLRPFVEACDRLLDIHSMSQSSPPLQLIGQQARHERLARALGAPAHLVADAGHANGTRLRDFGAFGQPDGTVAGDDPGRCALLVECGFHGALASRAVAQDQCLRFLVATGLLDDAGVDALLPGWRLPAAARQWTLDVTAAIAPRSTGFRFVRPLQGMEVIPHAGTVYAQDGDTALATPYDDCVMVMPSRQAAEVGVTAVRLARRRG